MIHLTPRQHDALEALITHHCYAQAAHALGISIRTFEIHMGTIRQKAGSVTAAAFALGEGRVRVSGVREMVDA